MISNVSVRLTFYIMLLLHKYVSNIKIEQLTEDIYERKTLIDNCWTTGCPIEMKIYLNVLSRTD